MNRNHTLPFCSVTVPLQSFFFFLSAFIGPICLSFASHHLQPCLTIHLQTQIHRLSSVVHYFLAFLSGSRLL